MKAIPTYVGLQILTCIFFSLALSGAYAQSGPDVDWGKPELNEQQVALVHKGKKYVDAYIEAYKTKHGSNPVFKLAGAQLSGADLSGYNLVGADLREADLRGIKLFGANLSGANLRGADVGEFEMNVADLTNADLSEANLHGADMTGAKFMGANLCGADLSQSSFIGTNMSKANMAGVNVMETDFEQSNADHTIMINVDLSTADNVDNAAIWENVIKSRRELNAKKFKFIPPNSTEEEINTFLNQHKNCICTWDNEKE